MLSRLLWGAKCTSPLLATGDAELGAFCTTLAARLACQATAASAVAPRQRQAAPAVTPAMAGVLRPCFEDDTNTRPSGASAGAKLGAGPLVAVLL